MMAIYHLHINYEVMNKSATLFSIETYNNPTLFNTVKSVQNKII